MRGGFSPLAPPLSSAYAHSYASKSTKLTRSETTDMIAPTLKMINSFQTQELCQMIGNWLMLFLHK